MANLLEGDTPASWVTLQFKASGNAVSVAICMLLYMTAYIGAHIKIKMSGADVPQWTQYQKKAWMMLLNIGSVYLYNRVSVATTIILWFATLAHIGAIALCTLPQEKREKLFKWIFIASVALSLLNWLIHWLTRTFTSLGKSMSA